LPGCRREHLLGPGRRFCQRARAASPRRAISRHTARAAGSGLMTESGVRPPNPYVGPRAFRAGERLYGRDHEVEELLDLLIAERIVLLHSPSGAGKTSLIQAALIPRIQEDGFQVLPVVRVSLEPQMVG